MIIEGIDVETLDYEDLAGLKRLNKRLEGSRNMKLDPEIAPYIDVEGSIKEQEENIRRYIGVLKRVYTLRSEIEPLIIDKYNTKEINEYLRAVVFNNSCEDPRL